MRYCILLSPGAFSRGDRKMLCVLFAKTLQFAVFLPGGRRDYYTGGSRCLPKGCYDTNSFFFFPINPRTVHFFSDLMKE